MSRAPLRVHRSKLVAPPADEFGRVVISRPVGLHAITTYGCITPIALLFGRPSRLRSTSVLQKPTEREQFLLAYLRAFEAQEDRIPGALRNMRHLFDRPELDF